MEILANTYKGYQDANTTVVLQDNIDDAYPYIIKLPDAPKAEDIINFGTPFEQQFFKKLAIPFEIQKLDESVKRRKITRGEAIEVVRRSKTLSHFVHSVFEKLTFGEWQYIRGMPVYITPEHFFQLNFCKNQGIYFSFRYEEALKAYWWDLEVAKNPIWYGGINLEGRRGGKTYFAGNRILYKGITSEYFKAGIQSKSELDAYQVFIKSVREPFRNIPFFLRPNTSSNEKTESSLDFSASQKILNDPTHYHDSDLISLNSLIDYKDFKDNSYDGEKLHFYLRDEAGKIPDIDVESAHKIIQQCLIERDPVERIIGKALYTSTIEELDKRGGKYFKNLYEASSRLPNRLNEIGRTKSGLAPYFVPAYMKEVFDQYGFSIVDDPLDYQIEFLKQFPEEQIGKRYLKGGKARVDDFINNEKDPNKQQENIRLKPRNLREAFRAANKKPLFNQVILNNRLDFFAFGYPDGYMTFGNFRRKGGQEDGEVEWVVCDESQARFHIKRLPPAHLQNAYYMKGNERFPGNTHLYTAGSDPFKFNEVKYKGSNGAGQVYEFFNPNIDTPNIDPKDYVTDNFCVEYLARPTVEEYCEDMLMMCEFYGCKMFSENNIDVVNKHFIKRKRRRYLKYQITVKKHQSEFIAKEEATAGGFTSDQYLETLYRYGNHFVDKNADRCPFYRTLSDFANMSIEDRTEFDLGMSGLYTLTGGFDTAPKTPEKETKKSYEMGIQRASY